jgi:peroxiredoxin
MVKMESSQILKTGYKAPDFNLIGVDGKMYSLNDFNSNTLSVIFICNHCPFVKARINDIIDLQTKFNVKELQIIGINSNDPNYEEEGFENMKKFSREYNLNFPYLVMKLRNSEIIWSCLYTRSFLFDHEEACISWQNK